mmetsp:Transcript_45101/g.63131  ORF Transcript_45101/g.63131 Transcript_45101/m.63131 type:complete len:297 (-) Transcript_45101:70-960(-)
MSSFDEWPAPDSSLPGLNVDHERAREALKFFDQISQRRIQPPKKEEELLLNPPSTTLLTIFTARSLSRNGLTAETYFIGEEDLSPTTTILKTLEETKAKARYMILEPYLDPFLRTVRFVKVSLPGVLRVVFSFTEPKTFIHPQENVKTPKHYPVFVRIDDAVVYAPDEKLEMEKNTVWGKSGHLIFQQITIHVKEAIQYFFHSPTFGEESPRSRFIALLRWLRSYDNLFVCCDPRSNTRSPSRCVICQQHLTRDSDLKNLLPPTFRGFRSFEPIHSFCREVMTTADGEKSSELDEK